MIPVKTRRDKTRRDSVESKLLSAFYGRPVINIKISELLGEICRSAVIWFTGGTQGGGQNVEGFNHIYLGFVTMYRKYLVVGPPLSKKLFPVGRVGKKSASREVGIFLFLISFCLKLECTGGKVKKNIFGKDKKKIQSALLDPPGRWTGNTFLFKGGHSNQTCEIEFSKCIRFFQLPTCFDSVKSLRQGVL